jgi:membrane protein DedA with SNARE-associated domain
MVMWKFCFLLAVAALPGFTGYISQYGYIGILIWFITLDQITPMPEEISLMVIGYLCAHGVFNPFLAGGVSLAAFLLIDFIYYRLTKAGKKVIKVKNSKLKWLMEHYKEKLQRHLARTILVLCFIPRMRMFAPILSGSTNVPARKFIALDAVILSVFTSLYMVLGFFFYHGARRIFGELETHHHLLFLGGAVIVSAVSVIFILRRKKTEDETQAVT